MFSLFKKDKSPSVPSRDKVWKTAEAAQKGMLMMAMMRLHQGQPALIVAFFEDEQQRLISFMSQNQIAYKEISESNSADVMVEPIIYMVSDSAVLSPTVLDLVTSNCERVGRTIYFPSHYPVIDYEEKVLTNLSRAGFQEFNFCLSFDDPMMTVFGAGKILTLLESLGLEDHEAIEHDLVTNSIFSARKKINEKVKVEIKAKSAEEWFKLNVRN